MHNLTKPPFSSRYLFSFPIDEILILEIIVFERKLKLKKVKVKKRYNGALVYKSLA